MTDALLAQQVVEVAVFGTTSDAQLAQQVVETTVYDTTSDAQLAQQVLEVAVGPAPSDAQLAQQVLEVTGYAIGSDAVVAQVGIEVVVYGNGNTNEPPSTGGQSGDFNPVGACTPGAGGISSTFDGYTPAAGVYTTPVYGAAVNNLTLARTPVGRIVLGWNEGNVFFVAVLDDAQDAFRNNVVGPNDRRTAFSTAGSLDHGSIWVDDGNLYMAVVYFTTDGSGRVECYVANDAENPTSWTLRGTIDSQAYGGGGFHSINSIGPVTITASGRWVIPCDAVIAYAGAAPSDGSGLFTSDDNGATWTAIVQHRRAPLFSGTSGPIGNTIAQDPTTGFLYWSHYDGPGANQSFIYESQDDGASWALIQANAAVAWHFYTDDGDTKFYAAAANGTGGWNAWEVTDPATNGFIDTGIQIINSNQNADQFQFHVLGCMLAVVDKNRVANGMAGGWMIHFIAIG